MMYIVTHKKINNLIYADGWAKYIKVGPSLVDNFDSITDQFDGGISARNNIYSELTAIFKIYKSADDPVIGICHYRRFFYEGSCLGLFDKKIKYKNVARYKLPWGDVVKKIINGDVDVYLPKKKLLVTKLGIKSIYEHFCFYKKREYFDLFISKIKTKDFRMGSTYEAYVKGRYTGSYWNMLICRNSEFKELFKFVFDILFDLEKEIEERYGEVEPRLMGYFTESFIPFWFEWSGKKIGYLNVAFLEDV